MIQQTFIKAAIKTLKIKRPVQVIFQFGKPGENDAEYQPRYKDSGKIKYHKITIFEDTERDVKTLIAHELIHAKQEENNVADIHGKYFQRKAKLFPDLPYIYMSDRDI